MPALDPLAHIGLAEIRDLAEYSNSREVLYIKVGDSRSTYGGENVRSTLGEILRQWGVKWAALHSHGMTANNGARDGLGQSMIGGLANISASEINMGSTSPNSSFVNRLPEKCM